jgi:hypothetical protein
MKLDKTFDLLRDRVSPPKSGKVGNLLKVAAGTAATVWVLLQLRRELYGPGGTRMSRYDPDVDELENAEELRSRVEDAREEADAQA